jgi:hypothetical protein
MTRRAYLHVGSPKTGTTFLQQVLWTQRDLALEQGLLLPSDGHASHYFACLDARDLATAQHLPDDAVGSWGRLVEQARAWPGDILVTHELFAPATAEQASRAIASLADEFEVHVVLTARDLVRQIPAEWQQHLKSRAVVTLPDFVAGVRRDESRTEWFWTVQDFAGVLRRWGSSLPASHVHLVTVPPASSPPAALWERFASVVGLRPETFRLDGFRANTSLGAEQAELLRLVNAELGDRLPKPGPYHSTVILVLAHRILAQRRGRPLRLTPEDRKFAAEQSRDLAADLASLGVDVVGDLADLVPEEEGVVGAVAAAPSYEVSREAVQDEGIAALAGLLDEYSSRKAAALARRRQFRERLDESKAKLAAARRDRVALRASLREARGVLAATRRTVDELEQRLAAAEADRDRLAEDRRRRPVRTLLVGLGERWPALLRVRDRYRRVTGRRGGA